MASTAMTTFGTWQSQLLELWEQPHTKKARRVAFHVVRAGKKFLFGAGNAAWVMGTSMLVMVMPLVFEIDREQQNIEYEAQMGMAARP
jgi:import receptor subunit TOM22